MLTYICVVDHCIKVCLLDNKQIHKHYSENANISMTVRLPTSMIPRNHLDGTVLMNTISKHFESLDFCVQNIGAQVQNNGWKQVIPSLGTS